MFVVTCVEMLVVAFLLLVLKLCLFSFFNRICDRLDIG